MTAFNELSFIIRMSIKKNTYVYKEKLPVEILTDAVQLIS
ncbi:hypothetical protein HMPREF1521_0536 [Veillonella sp. AS16]|nr:hypothetical protein HMPREF1521_0536 [Veillonella sp. AS16]